MSATQYPEQWQDVHFIIRPNNSISWRGTRIFFAAAAIVTFTVAILFALKGAWMVLPFAGLEIITLGVCLYICACKNTECEVIHIGEELVRVEKGRNKARQCVDFKRQWSSIELIKPERKWYPSRLFVRSMGREVEIGASLVEEDRIALANALQQKLARDH